MAYVFSNYKIQDQSSFYRPTQNIMFYWLQNTIRKTFCAIPNKGGDAGVVVSAAWLSRRVCERAKSQPFLSVCLQRPDGKQILDTVRILS